MKTTTLGLLSLLLTNLVNAQIPSYVPTNGLVGWWPFNGNANDESGNGYDGVVFGATLDADRNGNAGTAYYFSGNSTRISIPNTLPSLDPNVGPGVTISFWVKSLSLLTANSDLFDLRSTDNSDLHVLVNNPVGGSLQCDMYNAPNPPDGVGCYASGSFSSGNWMHIMVTQDHAAQISRLYANNLLVCDFVGSVPPLFNPHLNFGSRYDASAVMSQYMVGVLDDFGIWYRVLTANEIAALYNSTPPVPCVSPTPVSFTGLGTSHTVNDAQVTLTGSPAGGVFIGQGVTGSSFDPAAAGVGTHSVTYTYVDGNSCINTAGQCTEVTLNTATGGSHMSQGGVHIFPNPANGLFNLELDLQGLVSVQVFDATGRLAHSEVFQSNAPPTLRTLNLAGVAKGSYTLQVGNNGGTVTQQVVID